MKCTTCGISVVSSEKWIKFKCPNCGNEDIIRCERCRLLENSYKCRKCGFEGP